MCERWYCPFCLSHDCALPDDEACQYDEEEQERREYDDLGDRIYHERQDRELCNV